jgi:hypothetical protein
MRRLHYICPAFSRVAAFQPTTSDRSAQHVSQLVCTTTVKILTVDAVLISVTPLTIFGLFAVTAMLVFYALEARSRWFILAFAGACVLGSIYGFLQGAWPFGLVEAVWAVVAIRRWAVAARPK